MRGYLTPVMMVILVNGFAQNVGIGTLTPTVPLDVVGKIKATSLQVTENPGLHKLLTSDADGNAFWIDPIWRNAPNSSTTKQFGNVGIGEITTPAFPLHIVRPSAGYVTVMRLETNTANQGVGMELFSPITQGLNQNLFRLKANGQYFRLSAVFNNSVETNLMTVVPKNIANYDQGAFIGINMIDGTLPSAPLHVKGTSNGSQPANIRYFNYLTNPITANSWQGSTAIFAEGNICATEAFISAQSFTFSDKRLKKIIGKSDSREDLEKLNQLEVTRYQAADQVMAGDKILTKVVAQQVNEVMPEAVAETRGFIPSIMQQTVDLHYNPKEQTLKVHLKVHHNLQAGDRIKMLNAGGEELYAQVRSVTDAYAFDVHYNGPRLEKVFVYGKEVPDVQMVDYEAISMLNVSATQQLSKELEAAHKEIEMLKAQIRELYKIVTR
jgi:Chaperone of endosialidase